MVTLSVIKPEGLIPSENDIFDHADCVECTKFDYTY